MKVKKEFIGSKISSPVTGQIIRIEAENASRYLALGITGIYETEKTNKSKKDNVKNIEKRDDVADSDSNGIDNNSESELSI